MKIHLRFAIFLCFGLVPVISFADTISVPIIAFDDDAEEDLNTGTISRSSGDLEFGNQNLALQLVGLRFQSVGITAGSLIHSASITFTTNEADAGSLQIPIFGELSPDPVAFGNVITGSSAMPISVRPLTAATVLWEMSLWDPDPGPPGPGEPSQQEQQHPTSPDLSTIVQEIIDQGGWAAGNSMAFIFQNDPDPNETSERIAVSFDELTDPNHLLVPMLNIEFTPVPEPTAAFLIPGLAIGLGLRRKRCTRV